MLNKNDCLPAYVLCILQLQNSVPLFNQRHYGTHTYLFCLHTVQYIIYNIWEGHAALVRFYSLITNEQKLLNKRIENKNDVLCKQWPA